jgi:hypothetical protein
MTDADPLVPDRLHDASAGARLVYLALEAEAPARTPDLVTETGLAPRSVRRAVSELEDRGEVTIRTTLSDARFRQYCLATDDANPLP